MYDKQKVREFMQKREAERKRVPPPTPEEIRRQLGFELKTTRGTR